MKIFFPEPLAQTIRAAAETRGVTTSSFVRMVMGEYVKNQPGKPKQPAPAPAAKPTPAPTPKPTKSVWDEEEPTKEPAGEYIEGEWVEYETK